MTKETKRILLQSLLFIITFITTTLAGAEWAYGKRIYVIYQNGVPDFNHAYAWSDFYSGLAFSVPLLLFLTVHEFGHYFTARYHKVKSSLPYYIPFPPIPYLPFSIGTMGAVIRLRSRPYNNLQNFDIGLAGPLAGFIVALIIMAYGFLTLPPPDYIFQFHEEYRQFGLDYAKYVYEPGFYKEGAYVIDISIGKNLLFLIFEQLVADPSRIPNSHEIMHYPVLLASYFALFVTCLNLLPIGQLDGGHIAYGLFGSGTHRKIALVFFVCLLFYAGLGLPFVIPSAPVEQQMVWIPVYLIFLYTAFTGLGLTRQKTILCAVALFVSQYIVAFIMPDIHGYSGWLLFGLLLGRVIGVYHPPSEVEEPLNRKRIILGWIALVIFVLCFTPAPIQLEEIIGK